MQKMLRKSGIEAVGDVRWGAHLCLLYETEGDLLEALVPYFRSGLENNEFCLWVLPEPFDESAAREAMLREVPAMKTYLERGQMEFLRFADWYLPGGAFDPLHISQMTMSTFDKTRSCGYDGMRLAGDAAWVRAEERRAFAVYEKAVNKALAAYDILVICSYPSGRCGPDEIIDVMSSHHGVITKRGGRQCYIENAAHKLAHDSLRESEQRYRLLMQNSTDGIFIVDADGRIIETNTQAERLTGYGGEELAGMHFSELHPPEQRSRVEEAFRRGLAEGTEAYVEIPLLKKNGETILVDLIGSFFEMSGKNLGQAVVRDVTERRRTQDALRESEKYYRAIFENTGAATIIAEEDGTISLANSKFVELTGYTREEIEGRKKGFEFIHEDDRERVMQYHHLRRVDPASVPRDYELRLVDKNGNIRNVFNTVGMIPGTQKSLGSFIDITELMRVKSALTRSEENYRVLLENMMHGLAYCRMIYEDDRPQDFIYLLVNRAFETLTGLTNVAGKKNSELMPGAKESYLELFVLYDRVALTGAPEKVEIFFEPLQRWLSIALYSPEKGYFVAIFDNITERKRADQALRESELRYRSLFEDTPVAMKEENYAGVKKYLDGLRDAGTRDFQAYFEAHPDAVKECVRLVKIVDVNRAAQSLYKAESKAHLLTDLGIVFTDETFMGFIQTLACVAAGQTRMEKETVNRTLDGQKIHVLLQWVAAPGFEQTYAKVFVTMIDITERKQAEGRIRHLASFPQMDPNPVVEVDSSGKIAFSNPATNEMLKYLGMVEKGIGIFLPEDFQDILRALKKNELSTFYREVVVKDRVFAENIHLFPEFDAGRIYFYDITERKRADQALRESQERYHSLFENSPVSLWEEDFSEVKKRLDGLRESGVRDFPAYFEANQAVVEECQRLVKIVDVNKATVSLYRAADKGDLLQGLEQVFTDHTLKDFREVLILTAEGGTRLEAETVHRTLTGERIIVSLRWLVAPGYEKTYGKVYVSIIDITRRRQAEEQLLAYQSQLRSLSAELSIIEERERRRIATDLHDHIGQTLAMAKIKLGILREDVTAGPANSIDEIRGLVDQSIQYARSLIFELSMPILYELGLEAALEWLAEHVQAKYGLPVSIGIEGPPTSLGDEARTLLFKAVRELLMNVIKHAEAKGAEVLVCSSPDELKIIVEDEGRGFAASPGASLSGKTGGFGLFSVRERLKHAGGSMDIESAPGRGTRAIIRMPIRSEGPGHSSEGEE